MKPCTISNCSTKQRTKGYCQKHYWNLWKYGTAEPVNKYTKRAARIEGHIAYIPIGMNAKDGYAMVDASDAARVADHQWCLSEGYAHNRKVGRMHRLIVG